MKNKRIFICKEKEKVEYDHKSHSNKCTHSCYINSEFKNMHLLVCNLPNAAKSKKCKVEIFELKKSEEE